LSKEVKEEKYEITLEDLILRASQLRDYINALQNQINTVSAQISELQMVLDTLDALPHRESPILIVLDRLNTIFLPATISSNWHNEILVNIGRNYYVKTNSERAREIVSRRLTTLRRALDELTRRYQAALSEYSALQRILASIYAQYAQARNVQETSRESGLGAK